MQSTATATNSPLLKSLNFEELLAIAQKMKGKLQALNETDLSTQYEAGLRANLASETNLVFTELNSRLARYGAQIIFADAATNVELFIFSSINPLDCMPVRYIIGAEIIGDYAHLQIVGPDGTKSLRKVPHNNFIRTQIEQFRIPIEAEQ